MSLAGEARQRRAPRLDPLVLTLSMDGRSVKRFPHRGRLSLLSEYKQGTPGSNRPRGGSALPGDGLVGGERPRSGAAVHRHHGSCRGRRVTRPRPDGPGGGERLRSDGRPFRRRASPTPATSSTSWTSRRRSTSRRPWASPVSSIRGASRRPLPASRRASTPSPFASPTTTTPASTRLSRTAPE